MKSFKQFLEQFKFDPGKNLMVGIERECYLINKDDEIAPLAVKVLNHLGFQNGHFGYELSACQLEWRIGPCLLSVLKDRLVSDEAILEEAEKKIGFKRHLIELSAKDEIPLEVYPDPAGRYERIVKKFSKSVLSAACRAMATHIHIGMPDHQTALRVYNVVVSHFEKLCQLSGRCLDNYGIVMPNYIPLHYNNWKDFYDLAIKNGFTDNPRSCWHMIRLSVHGTIEFRMFRATESLDEIVSWTTFCRELCKKAEN